MPLDSWVLTKLLATRRRAGLTTDSSAHFLYPYRISSWLTSWPMHRFPSLNFIWRFALTESLPSFSLPGLVLRQVASLDTAFPGLDSLLFFLFLFLAPGSSDLRIKSSIFRGLTLRSHPRWSPPFASSGCWNNQQQFASA